MKKPVVNNIIPYREKDQSRTGGGGGGGITAELTVTIVILPIKSRFK